MGAPHLPAGVRLADLEGGWRFSRVEETWEVRLDADGAPAGALVHRRAEQLLWRGDHFVVRRAGRRRARIMAGVVALGAMIAAFAGLVAIGGTIKPARSGSVIVPLTPAAEPPKAASGPMSRPAAAAPVTRVPVPPALAESRVAVAAEPSAAPADAPPADTLPIDALPTVKAAITRAFASGESEPWSDGALSGYVVVGPVELVDGASCRPTVVLARGDFGDRTLSRRRCVEPGGAIEVREGG